MKLGSEVIFLIAVSSVNIFSFLTYLRSTLI